MTDSTFRLTDRDIDALIHDEAYYVFPGTTVTVCCITTKNGFSVVGESACLSLNNFDREIGQKIARENAREKLWALEGYAYKTIRNQK
jgi:hypothetical protein